MSYVKHILLPSEQVLYDGHVHPTVLLPGLLWLGFAAFILTISEGTHFTHSLLLGITGFLGGYMSPFAHLHDKFVHWQQGSSIALDLKALALIVALYGFSKIATAFVLMDTTELIITDQRVIAKMGILTVTTVEMDRRRIAGVTIYQTLAGRIMGYGNVFIQGFTSHIGGLPPMVNPHLVERFIG